MYLKNIHNLNEMLRVGIFEFAFLFKLLLMPFKVLDHQILPREFIMVPEVIHSLVRLQMEMVEDIVDAVAFDPE